MAANSNPVIIGAGPAGLTAGLQLLRRGVTPRIVEASAQVGGLARTPVDGAWRIDPGGHRFFTKSEEVAGMWRSLLPADQWIAVPRRSAMLVDRHFVRYPLRGRDLMLQRGIGKGLRGLGSLMWSRIRTGPHIVNDSVSFQDWGTYEFGRQWYQTFFDGYVRKTWLTEPEDIASDWANQRIKPIDWRLRSMSDRQNADVFRYPRLGPGQLWEAAAAALQAGGAAPVLNCRMVKARCDGESWTLFLDNGDTLDAGAVFASMPLHQLIEALEPLPPKHIRAVAARLRHRSLITVAVAVSQRREIPFHWVYTPGADFRCGRIQNYSLWSPDLQPAGWYGTHLGFEYFLDADSPTFTVDDDHLVKVVHGDLHALGFGGCTVEHVMITRSQHAYPVHDATRERSVQRIRNFLATDYPTLYPIGRNGMHHYDNQDHAMLSAMQSVAKYFGTDIDPWQANTDRHYHETGLTSG